MTILSIFVVALGIRLISLFVSISNEKKLKAAGALEYGKTNSLILTLSHIVFYGLAITEALVKNKIINEYTYAGLALFAFSMFILFMVIKHLGHLWTVKLIIAPDHHVVRSFLFKFFRHPNYFLNVIPELIAIALICQAWMVMMIGLPLYLIPLIIRIYQEEMIMRQKVAGYNI
jgi:isoprenylcysteine carboxyl methyltransferase (ICMT) family protein YpbQ